MVRAESYGAVPQFRSVLWGDNNWATVLDTKGPYKNESGIWMKKYLIVINERLVKKYPWLLKEEKTIDTHYGPAIWVEYPYDLINDKDTSLDAIERVYCAFDGSETTETERHKYYTERIKDLQKENNHYKESNAYYVEALGQALNEIEPLAKKMAELMGIIKGGKIESEEEQI